MVVLYKKNTEVNLFKVDINFIKRFLRMIEIR